VKGKRTRGGKPAPGKAPEGPAVRIDEAAAMLSVGEKTIRRLIRDGELCPVTVEGEARVPVAELHRLFSIPRSRLDRMIASGELPTETLRGGSRARVRVAVLRRLLSREQGAS